MAEPRRIVLADPLAGPSTAHTRFAVAGQGAPGAPGDVKMYEWDGETENMSLVGLQTDVGGGIKALAWSPHPAQRHLLALGLSTGRTNLITLSPSSLSLPLRGTPHPTSVLSVKHSRAVTALAFSAHDPNLLAVGYDRHRSDHSLLIWDINDIVASFPPDPEGDVTYARCNERLEAMNNQSVRDSPRHLQHYCPSEVVHSIAWVPGSGHELYASANNKSIRLYDLRAPGRDAGTTGSGQWSTRAVHFLTPDPERPTRLASVEGGPQGGVVRLWDSRRPGTELSSLDIGDGNAIVALQWAPRSSELAIGTREGGVFMCDVVTGPSRQDGTEDWVTMGDVRHVVKPKQHLHSFAFTPSAEPTHLDVVFVVKDGTIGVGPVGQAPAIAMSSRNELAVSSSYVQIIDPETIPRTTRGTPEGPSRVHSRVHSRAVSPRRLSTDERRKNRFQLAPERVSALLSAEKEQAQSRSASPRLIRGHDVKDHRGSLIDELDEEEDDLDHGIEVVNSEGFRQVLRHDPAMVMRRRAEEGYGLENLLLNAAVGTRFPGSDRIAGAWEFVDHFIGATAPEVSRHNGYDLTYQGLWPIWTGRLGPEGREETTAPLAWTGLKGGPLSAAQRESNGGSGASTPRRGHNAIEVHDAEYTAAVAHINAMRADESAVAAPGSHRLPHTEKGPLRRMMLAVCGENHAYDTMEEVHRLVDDNQRTKAACWAFFAGEEGPAVTILMRSDEEKHRLMGATIAGFMTQSRAERGSLFWQEHWRSMVDKVDDPYVRAVLARIAGENWDGILYDESLPLLDRVAVAVCNLGDKDLTSFLRNRLNRCIQLGSLPGLALTGFTPSGIVLIQRYIDRTGDIQTATLLASYFPRAHLSSRELATVERWTDAYRSLLDSWLAWIPRCSLDVALLEQRRRIGETVADTIQTVVVCPVCNSQLTKQTEEMLTRKNALRGAIRAPTVRTTTCMYCQNALPRCSVCLLHVAPTPDAEDRPDTMGGAFVSCQTCRHGGHVAHILGWFEGGLDGEPAHDICPVAGCDCQCASL